ncbi:MAG: agmatinase, partial [Porcipelethomonas sp.]
MEKNIHTFIGCDSEYSDSRIVIFGAPFDSTTSYRPGTRFASAAMRNESFGIETYSPYQDKDLTDIKVFDAGDPELCFGSPESALEDIEKLSEKILNDGKMPLMIGGEHLVTLGSVRAAVKKYPDLHIVHFDAHADLRDDYLGQKLSHACVMRRCHELVGDGKIFQFGIRSGDREEFYWGKNHVYTNKFNFDTIDTLKEKIGSNPVYFTIDLDVLDPSCFPGTGTPEAGGVTFTQLMNAI